MKYREGCERPSPEPAPGCPFFSFVSFLFYCCKLYMLKVYAIYLSGSSCEYGARRRRNSEPDPALYTQSISMVLVLEDMKYSQISALLQFLSNKGG